MDLLQWKEWFATHEKQVLADFFSFLRFRSIATDPKFSKETKDCAKWLVSYLEKIGLSAQLWETKGQPIVFGKHTKAGKNAPTLLIYQHYDVQPVDPLELWRFDPFEPVMVDKEIYARGAQDNKGQCFYTITAIAALLQFYSSLPFNLLLFIEGEEESGSKNTSDLIKQKQQELKSDYLLVVDSGIPKPNMGAITLGIRGIMTMEVTIRCANTDMHSGSMGGVAYNPIKALTRVLSSCYDPLGKVAIPHFYDQVQDLSEDEKKMFDLSLDEKEMIQKFGLRALSPEPGYSIGESMSIRPTFEINGISGGYTKEGFKTVLPAEAKAKISARLVPNQDPNTLFTHIENHLRKHLPKGIEMDIVQEQGAIAFRSDPNSLIAKRVAKAYEEVLGKPCMRILSGGSIPITTELANLSGADTVMMGFGLDDDNIHAPNEHFGKDRFEQGFLTMGRIFERLHEKDD